MGFSKCLGYGVWSALGVALALACSASGEKRNNVNAGGTGATATGGSSGSSASGGVGGIGNAPGTGGSGNVGIDAGIKDSAPPDPDAACQTVTQKANKPAVDIIWIIDNSCSMGDEVDKVRTNVNQAFVPIIDQSIIDWRVIMVTEKGNATEQVCVDPPLAGANCADNPPKFHHLNCKVESSDSLTVVTNAYAAPGIACAGGTQAWNQHVRYDATKVFVEVTDDGAGWPFMLAAGFDNWALNVAQPAGVFGTAQARKYIFHGILGMDPNDPNAACTSATNNGVAPGIEYQKLAQMTGGILRSICENDWSDIFNTIAAGIVNKLSCEYAVPPPGDGGTIDPDKVNVSFTPGSGGQTEDILQDNNAGCDQGADGWQWDASKTKILLCGPTCDKVKADENGQVDIIFGCKTKVAPPPS